MSDDFTVMRRGQVVFSGPKEQIDSTDPLIRYMFGNESLGALPERETSKRLLS